MARIRSVHPGLYTDEGFMAASMAAKVLIVGLWCQASDSGVFEWKPIVLKARLFPADAVDVAALLDELEQLGFIRQFEREGKAYGAIRNFRKFQKPKHPTPCKLLPPGWGPYVGLTEADSCGLTHCSGSPTPVLPQDGVKTPSDGVGEEKEKRVEAAVTVEPDPCAQAREPEPAAAIPIDALRAKLLACLPADCSWPIMVASDLRPIFDVLREGADLEGDVLPVLRQEAKKAASSGRKLGNWSNVAPHVRAKLERDRQAVIRPEPEVPKSPGRPEPLPVRELHLLAARKWLDGDFGTRFGFPPPGHPGCPISEDVIAEARAEREREAAEYEAECARRAEFLKGFNLDDVFTSRH